MVISRTPLRVSFVGGGSDLPSFSREHGGAVISTAIDKYVHVIVTERFEEGLRVSYSETEIVADAGELKHELVRESLRMAGLPRGLEVVTIADVPARGTGLGSSSAVTVGLLNALFAYQGILKRPNELAQMACRIEIDVLGKPIGRQDQFACAHGGLQFLSFGPGDGVDRQPLAMDADRMASLQRNLLMFYTGRRRQSDRLLAEIAADEEKVVHLTKIRDGARELFEVLRESGDPDLLGEQLHRNWELKRDLHGEVSSPEIDESYARARDAGALGGKLLGAGGGGFLLVYAHPDSQPGVRAALGDLRELHFRFEAEGSRIVHVG